MKPLLDSYLQGEVNERGLGRIEATVYEASLNRKIAVREFGGNAITLVLDFERQVAVLESVLDASEAGTLVLPIDEFLRVVGARAAGCSGGSIAG
ncbi:hypothetical protein [Roseateles asaccharophilus]|uniref:Uncharacterized protein n=1 Tax=Roseateles asaccharophilus TaxID=582607 RepID=A0ABU2AF36_9BURK|nr:hypothetical protein [Roseateles asaccharophilus]MDR7335829.1 hypothetical protein [Roseateles asaccharophilus]